MHECAASCIHDHKQMPALFRAHPSSGLIYPVTSAPSRLASLESRRLLRELLTSLDAVL